MYLICYFCGKKIPTMKTIDTSKLHSADELLDSKYGAEGTESRAEFEAKARAYYHSVIRRDHDM